jgi:hypothetical protein
LPRCHDFRRGWKVAEVYADMVGSNDDFIGDVFDDFTFFIGIEGGPAGIKVFSFTEDLIA